MRDSPLQRLLEAARALPDERDEVELPVVPVGEPIPSDASPPAPEELRRGVGELLLELARRTEPALEESLRTAMRAWDQADALTVLDAELRAQVDELAARARTACWAEDPGTRAAGTEALLAINAAVGLVALVERRLATFIRLRIGGGGDLFCDDRPFLDIAAALRDAARGWA